MVLERELIPPDEELDCVGCGERLIYLVTDAVDGWALICQSCSKRIPSALVKACSDHFYYGLRLTTGELIYFNEARIKGDWVHLDVADGVNKPDHWHKPPPSENPLWERGVDVRLDQIVWVADAPHGS